MCPGNWARLADQPPPAVPEAFSATGTTHLLAFSGMNLAVA
jgi:predicted membrane metal-binding protein